MWIAVGDFKSPCFLLIPSYLELRNSVVLGAIKTIPHRSMQLFTPCLLGIGQLTHANRVQGHLGGRTGEYQRRGVHSPGAARCTDARFRTYIVPGFADL